MNKTIDISHSFRAKDQFYRLLTVRFAFQMPKTSLIKMKHLNRALRFGYLLQQHACSHHLSHQCLPYFDSPHREVLEVLG